MTDSTELIRQLIALYGPPGEEHPVRTWLENQVRALGYTPTADAKGNLLVTLPGKAELPSVLITAHMDEIALMITQVEADGKIRVAAYGGAHPWKWGEGPMSILTAHGPLPAILSFGCIHTESPLSVATQARTHPLTWPQAYLFTGLDGVQAQRTGIRPGLRVVLAQSRRVVTEFGPYVASYFLDDRADLAVWLMALEVLREASPDTYGPLTFAATTSEEVGAEGAKYILRRHPHDICVALEIGPKTPEADFPIDSQPTIWVRDGYAAMESIDGDILHTCAAQLEQTPHWQYLSRGGSDATCAVANGLCARPVTLGLPTENSHGYEIIHRNSPTELLRLLMAYLQAVGSRHP